MCKQTDYKDLKEELSRQKKETIKSYFNKRNIITGVISIAILSLLFVGASYADKKAGSTVWVDRYFNVGCSGLIVALLSGLFKSFKDNKSS